MADFIYGFPYEEPYLLPLEGGSGLLADLSLQGILNLQGGGLFGESDLFAEITWRASPGAPPRMPSTNSAATLQQFIDATGVGRSVTRVTPTHSVVVDPNPPRKPQSPR